MYLPSNTVPLYEEVTQLWTAMTKRHQVCEEIESMGGKINKSKLIQKKKAFQYKTRPLKIGFKIAVSNGLLPHYNYKL